MRLVGAAFLIALASLAAPPSALADDAKPADPKPTETRAHVPLRVVRMLPDAGQALLFDRTKGTYVAVEAGQAVEGFTVDTVDDDEVTLVSDAGATVVLAAPARHRRTAEAGNADDGESDETARPARHHARPARVAAADAASSEPKPADPYATEANPADPYADASKPGQPSDPYGDGVQPAPAGSLGTGIDGVRVVDAAATAPTVIGTGADGVRVASAAAPAGVIGTSADGVRVASAAPAPTVAAPAPAAVAAPAPAAVAAPGPAAVAAPAPVAVAAAAAAPAPAAVTVTAAAPVAAPVPAAVTVTAAAPVAVPHPAATTTPTKPSTARKPARKSYDDGAAALAAALTGADDDATTTAPSSATAAAIVLPRADVRAALSNFGALSKGVQGGFTPDGLRIDAVAAGSLFARAGLQPGDVVTSVDGKPLRSLDDAADLYARASKARSLTAQVLRGGAPVALRVSIQ